MDEGGLVYSEPIDFPPPSARRPRAPWRVTGHDVLAATVTTIAGAIGRDSMTMTRLDGAQISGRPLHTYRDGTSLIATMQGASSKTQMALAMLNVVPFRWDLWRIVNGERARVGSLPGYAECGEASERDETLVCVVRGRSGITLWRLSANGAGATSLGALPGGLDFWRIGAGGRLAATARDGSTLAIVDGGSAAGSV